MADDREEPIEYQQLREIRRKIERATENLALADQADFAGIARLLDKWRMEEAALVARIGEQTSRRPAPAALLAAIDGLAQVRADLHLVAAGRLAGMFAQLIERITVHRLDADYRQRGAAEVFGEIRFYSDVCEGGAVPFQNGDVAPKRRHDTIREFIAAAGQPVRSSEIAEGLGLQDNNVRHILAVACRRGLVRKVGRRPNLRFALE